MTNISYEFRKIRTENEFVLLWFCLILFFVELRLWTLCNFHHYSRVKTKGFHDDLSLRYVFNLRRSSLVFSFNSWQICVNFRQRYFFSTLNTLRFFYQALLFLFFKNIINLQIKDNKFYVLFKLLKHFARCRLRTKTKQKMVILPISSNSLFTICINLVSIYNGFKRVSI